MRRSAIARYIARSRSQCPAICLRSANQNNPPVTTHGPQTGTKKLASKMPRSPVRQQQQHHHSKSSHHQISLDSQIWPDETIVILPETPRVRLSPRRRMNPQNTITPGWPPANIGNTIRMYHDPEDEEQQDTTTVDFTMNRDFIESTPLLLNVCFCVWV
jgi:hypothetical protein